MELKKKVKAILQECYNVDLASDRGREWVADMLVKTISGDDGDELYSKGYYDIKSSDFAEENNQDTQEGGGISNYQKQMNAQTAFLAKIEEDNARKHQTSIDRMNKKQYRESRLTREALNEINRKENEYRAQLNSDAKIMPEVKPFNFFGEGGMATSEKQIQKPKQQPDFTKSESSKKSPNQPPPELLKKRIEKDVNRDNQRSELQEKKVRPPKRAKKQPDRPAGVPRRNKENKGGNGVKPKLPKKKS